MQCPIPVEGCECGAEAKVQSAWNVRWDEAVTMHFSCVRGHRFHIGPRERWQMCRCLAAEKAIMDEDCLHTFDKRAEALLGALAAYKGIQIIVPERRSDI